MIDFFGGRKTFLGILYLGLVSLQIILVIFYAKEGLLGFAPVILAEATGVGAIVWGNVKEHEFNGKTPTLPISTPTNAP